ncbi:MAG TPA: trypsin-like peptidase domain-containing protein [Sporichthyaceae bacterium]|nr:trypsin-like peptidase domain-containing protein [Sporichthyaceae bacterium]
MTSVPGPYGEDSNGDGTNEGGSGPPRRPRRATRVLRFLAVAVAVAGAGAGIGVTLAVEQPAATTTTTSLPGAGHSPATSPSVGRTTGKVDAQDVVNKVEPGLVVVNTTLKYSDQAAAGTGMVINPDGLVLTNNHVIENSAKITATVTTTGKTYPATVIGYDETADVALIRLQGATGLRTIPIGNSAVAKTGEQVVALGNAEGTGAIVPAGGRVTGLDKAVIASDEATADDAETLSDMIQINAGIVPGDSGGPLNTSAGQVIGMDTAGNSTSTGKQPPEGFAIPIDTALSIAGQVAAGHASSTVTVGYPPFIGIFTGSGTSTDPQIQAQQQQQQNGFGDGTGGLGGYNGFGRSGSSPACFTSDTSLTVPTTIARVGAGTLIDGTICGGPAATAGMTAGSVVTAINGQAAGSPASLASILARFKPGDTISVTWVSPAGQPTTSAVHLTAGPPH